MPVTIDVKIQLVPFGRFVFREQPATAAEPAQEKPKAAPYQFPEGTAPLEPRLLYADSLVEFT